MSTATTPELIVSNDWVSAALEVIRDAEPRKWALSGGNTPAPLYRRLRELDLPWSQVECFFGDERCVPPEHPDSNYGMAARALEGVPVQLFPMPGATCDAPAYEALLRVHLSIPISLDLALLGLGEDGHTASLFPGDPVLEEREHWVVAVPHEDYQRMTLTLPVLSASRLALFLVTGRNKREALRMLLEGEPIPASMVRAERVVVIADHAAAG
jgi:6-phosphogluconolactonase